MKTLADFDQFLQTSVIQGQHQTIGWDCKVQDTTIAAGPKTHLYVYDYRSGWTWMAGVQRAMFGEFAACGQKLSPEDAAMARGAIVSTSAALRAGDPSKTLDAERCLGCAISLYAGQTKTYQMADRFIAGGHFCIILYRSKRDPSITEIRPFAAPVGDGQAMDASVFKALINRVIEHDKERNPQWIG